MGFIEKMRSMFGPNQGESTAFAEEIRDFSTDAPESSPTRQAESEQVATNGLPSPPPDVGSTESVVVAEPAEDENEAAVGPTGDVSAPDRSIEAADSARSPVIEDPTED